MSELLVLQLPADPGAPIAWCTRPARAAEPGPVTRGDLEQAAAAARGRRVAALVPQARVSLRQVPVPARSRAQQARAVPFALEDEIAADVDDTHFAVAAGSGNPVPVAVVARAHVEEWLAALRGAGIEPDLLCPEGLALPRGAEDWALLPGAEGALLRSGPHEAHALEGDTGALVLDTLLARAEPPPEALRVLATPEQEEAPAAYERICARHGVTLRPQGPPREALAWLAAGLDDPGPLDLLQGPYRTGRTPAERLAPWRPAAALAVLLVAVEGAAQVADFVQLSREQARLEAEVAARFQAAFPDVQRIVNPRVQAEQRLARLRGGGAEGPAFLGMLTAAGEALTSLPGTTLQGVTFRGGVLYLDLQAGDLQSLDRLKSTIAGSAGLAVSIQTASAQEDGVRGRLRIEAGPA
jgi:general secretion pathway protein L